MISVQAFSNEAKKCGSRYRIAMNAFAPLYWRNDSGNGGGKVQGLTYDLVGEITRRTGCILNQDPMPFPRATTELSHWRIDFYAFSLPIKEWNEYANYDVVYNMSRVLVVSDKVFAKNKSIDDYVNDKSIKFADTIGSPLFLKDSERELLKTQGRMVDLTTPEQGYDQLKSGRVQAMFSSPVINRFFLDQLHMRDHVKVLRDTKSLVTIGLYSSKKRVSAEERTRMQNVIKEIHDDGTLRAILSKYLDPEDLRVFYGL